MDYNNFLKWCALKEPKLNKYLLNYNILNNALFIHVGLLLFFFLFFKYIAVNLLQYSEPLGTPFVLGIYGLSILIMIVFEKIFPLPMDRIEYISCLLNKISKEIELYQGEKDKKELVQDLKAFKQLSKFKLRFPNKLFKKENEIQKNFLNSINSLPDRIYYVINEEKLNEINLQNIRELTFYIYTDSQQKIETLNKIIRENPNTKEIEFKLAVNSRKLYGNNWFKLVIVTALLSLLFYFFVYGFLDIDKNTTFIGFITLFTAIVYIIFKK